MTLYTLCVHLQIVHGDLKSLNILLTRGWQLAKLGDVGVARYLKSKDVPDHVARELPAAISMRRIVHVFCYAVPHAVTDHSFAVQS